MNVVMRSSQIICMFLCEILFVVDVGGVEMELVLMVDMGGF